MPTDYKTKLPIRVVDFCHNLPGPYLCKQLRDLGCTVVRLVTDYADPAQDFADFYQDLNSSKSELRLKNAAIVNKEPEFAKLIAESDVFVTSFRGSALKKMGIEFSDLKALNPNLVYCLVRGFDSSSPYSHMPAHDINLQASSGFVSLNNMGDSLLPISDYMAALDGSQKILAAILRGKCSGGTAQFIECDMENPLKNAVSNWRLLDDRVTAQLAIKDSFDGSKHFLGVIPTYGLFECADELWVAMGIVGEDHFWRKFCELAAENGESIAANLVAMDFGQRCHNFSEIRRICEAVIKKLPRQDLLESALKWQIPLSPVY